MKKRIIALLLALLAVLAVAFAFAQDQENSETTQNEVAVSETVIDIDTEMSEEEQRIFDITGAIIDITDEYIAIENAELGEVHVLTTEDTIIEGAQAPQIGQTVVIMYNGMMTRSLPPQITALHIGVYGMAGVITEIGEESITIVRGDTGEETILTLDEALMESFLAMELEEGDEIVAYTTGLMTMSLPPMMNAVAIMPAFEATPGEATEAEALEIEALEIEEAEMIEEVEMTEEAEG